MLRLSIIIPVYNGGSTLARAAGSVMRSTAFREGHAELIIINDGSTDSTGDIAEQLRTRDSKVSVVHTPNQGVSAARNRGIEEARGTLVAFLDADDYVLPDFHAIAAEPLTRSTSFDLSITAFTRVRSGDESALHVTARDISSTCVAHEVVSLARQGLLNPPWNKVYRTDVIHDNAIRFETGRAVAEDLFFNLDYLATCRGVSVLEESGIFFVANSSSVTHRRTKRYDPDLELSENTRNREIVRTKLQRIGVPEDSISTYFKNLDQVWFHRLVKNVSSPGTPLTYSEQIESVRTIMNLEPVRSNILQDRALSKLALVNRTLYRIDHAALAWLLHRLL